MRKSFVGGAPYRIAKVKAVELRQKNRDELLTEIENYKKELSQVFLLYSISPSSSVLPRSQEELLPSLLRSRSCARTLLVL